MTPSIQIKQMSKFYKHVVAIDSLDLEVQRGEIFGLLGANGAGKTTLIKVLVGLLKADKGDVSVLGLNPATEAIPLRQRTGYMPQSPALYDDLSALENLTFFGRARPQINLKERIDEVLTFLDLKDRQHDPVYTFSGGMKQRLNLGVALLHKPELLLLDEPSTGVDPKLRESLWDHFRALVDQGVTILVSTHQMDEAHHCDRIAIMRDGHVLATDTPRGLLSQGAATVRIWRDSGLEETELAHYAEQLPRTLGLTPDIKRIEVQEQTLEDVVLKLIRDTQATTAEK